VFGLADSVSMQWVGGVSAYDGVGCVLDQYVNDCLGSHFFIIERFIFIICFTAAFRLVDFLFLVFSCAGLPFLAPYYIEEHECGVDEVVEKRVAAFNAPSVEGWECEVWWEWRGGV
jgi:hypothetical protein